MGGTFNTSCLQRHGQDKLSECCRDDQPGWWNDAHINGNAIYSTDRRFSNMLHLNSGLMCSTGYDWWLSHRPELFGAFGGRLKRDSRFMDCKAVAFLKGDYSTMRIEQLTKLFPSVVMVHSNPWAKNPTLHDLPKC